MDEAAEQNDDLEHVQRLKAAIHYTVGQICQEVVREKNLTFAKSTIASISELTFCQAKLYGQDLEHFAKHAKRSTITEDDVKLLVRRNKKLGECIQKLKEEQQQQKLLKKQKKASKPKKDVPVTTAIQLEDDDST